MKQVREILGLSQEQMAEHLHVTQRTVSRVELGERDLGVWEYFALMDMAGKPTEDSLPLLLDSSELKDYNTYKDLKRLLRDRQYAEIREILPKFEKGKISKQPHIIQFVEFVKIVIDEELSSKEALAKLYEVLGMSIKNFDEERVSECRFTHSEIYILTSIAMKLEEMGKFSCAIGLYKDLIESRGNALATDEDKSAMFPALMYNLSRLLGKSERYVEALKYCNDAHGIIMKYKNYRMLPNILYHMAYYSLAVGEEEEIYQTHFIRAYHVAHAMDNKEIMRLTKKVAEKFGYTDL